MKKVLDYMWRINATIGLTGLIGLFIDEFITVKYLLITSSFMFVGSAALFGIIGICLLYKKIWRKSYGSI